MGEAVATGEIVGSLLLTSFAGVASWALWFYGQRYVGELALIYFPTAQLTGPGQERAAEDRVAGSRGGGRAQEHASRPDVGLGADIEASMCLQVSTLDFWGKRQVREAALLTCTAGGAALLPAAC